MERIKLTKREKRVLRLLLAGNPEALSDFDAPSLATLQSKGLVQSALTKEHCVDDARLTTMGKEYISDNPHLLNPINWTLIFSAIAAIAAVTALFVS